MLPLQPTHAAPRPSANLGLNRRSLLASCIVIPPLLAQLSGTAQQAACAAEQHEAAAELLLPSGSNTAAEPACASCVGYVDGTLGSCSAVDVPCCSSYDDRPAHFVAPWEYEGSTEAALQQLVNTLETLGVRVQQRTDDYVYGVLERPGSSGPSLDLEFVFAPNDTTVALRAAQHPTAAAASTGGGTAPSPAQAAVSVPVSTVSSLLNQLGFNRDDPTRVLEDVRMQLGWEVVPILRNRQRLFLFGESPFDSFGPVPPPVPDYNKDLMDF